jgi:NAD(P)-dependent dehydrogenase (short-subunit alcohol dehydrogenase family)
MGAIRYGLEDRVFVVTGGSRGIGLEIAKELFNQGAKVAICGRKQETLDTALNIINGQDRVISVSAHIAKEDDVEKMFKYVLDKYHRVDALINNVGMNLITASAVDTDTAVWQKIMDTNLNGTFLCSRRASKIMQEQKKGVIVNVSSIAGSKASPGMGIYGIAKAGVEMLTKVLAAELAQFGIRVNAVAPSMVRTEFSKPFWSNNIIHDQIIKGIPLGRIAEPIEVVHPVLFLASDASDFITGQTLLVDGGTMTI